MNEVIFLQLILIWIIPLLLAITLHEVAHGWVASWLGDPTAKMLGRLTLNPFKHIDPMGTILIPATLLFLGGFVFGWAKPVPVTQQNFKFPARDMALVAVAGPLANLSMAILWALCVKITELITDSHVGAPLALIYMGQVGILLNISLFALNLLPLPPLDGGKIVSYLLPKRWAFYFTQLEPYGFVIILLLLATGLLAKLIGPFVYLMREMLMNLVGL